MPRNLPAFRDHPAGAWLLLTAVGQIVSGPSVGHRLQGLGSALSVIRIFALLAWVVTELLPGLTLNSDALGRDRRAASPATRHRLTVCQTLVPHSRSIGEARR